ncbi:MAG: hypothetical protein Q9191_000028 [Dirinaria sp. TL-2023a]
MADPATLIAAEQVVSTTVETGAVAAYGLAQKTQPLDGTFNSISSPAFLPRSHHTLTVVEGKGYIWGGYNAVGTMAGADMHIVQMPSKLNGKGKGKGEGEAEYKVVPALAQEFSRQQGEGNVDVKDGGATPCPRADHTAVAIGERIYVFGGTDENMQVIEEQGRVWVFDTMTLHWSFLDSQGSPQSYPCARLQHGSASTEHPLPPGNPKSPASTYKQSMQNTVVKASAMIGGGIPESRPHGTLFVCFGLNSPDTHDVLTDSWSFDIATQVWTNLPSMPASTSISAPPSVAMTHHRLYVITSSSSSTVGSEIHYLPIPKSSFYDTRASAAEADPNSSANLQSMVTSAETPASEKKGEWTSLPFPNNPIAPGPRPRKGAGLVPVTTGNGREYLIYGFGQRLSTPASNDFDLSSGGAEKGEVPLSWSDIWSYQAPAQPTTVTAVKDATRSALGIASGEGTWAEVKIVADVEEVSDGRKPKQQAQHEEKSDQRSMEGGEGGGKSHPGPRSWFASAGLDGSGIVLWGGSNAKGEIEGDGWVIRVK